MPLPFLLGASALIGGALGIGAQLSAKETNATAQEIREDAQNLYNSAKHSLEEAKLETAESLLSLGKSKKIILETSINQFLAAYESIKNIELSKSVGLDEIKNFTIEKQDTIQLREMSNIYESTFASGATGAATGAIIALAASGSLPVVTSVLSTAGTVLMAGQVSVAAGLAGSALSFGVAMTPLAAIAAPALLFSGISSSIKADENLEKARTTYAEAEKAGEQMRTSEVLCSAISDRAVMFDELLQELNVMFSQCTSLLENVINKKKGLFQKEYVDANKFTEDELKLVAVTRALAGAVKAVIDTPILTANGAISSQSQTVYSSTVEGLPALVGAVDEVKRIDYRTNAIQNKKVVRKNKKVVSKNETSNPLLDATRNTIAFVLGAFVGLYCLKITLDYGFSLIAFALPTLIIMNNQTEFRLFKLIKLISCFSLAGGFTIAFYENCFAILQLNYSFVFYAVIGVISMVVFGVCIPDKGQVSNSLKRTLARLSLCIFFFSLGILLLSVLYKSLDWSYTTSIIVASISYAFFTLITISDAN